MTDLSNRPHHAFADSAKLACQEVILRLLREAGSGRALRPRPRAARVCPTDFADSTFPLPLPV